LSADGIAELAALLKAEALTNSKPFNTRYRFDASPIAGLLKKVYRKLGLNGKGKRVRSYRRHVRIIVANVLEAYDEDQKQYLGISLNANSYSCKGRYSGLGMSYRSTINALNLLENVGLLEKHRGYYDRKTGGRCTRIRATNELISLRSPGNDHISIASSQHRYEPIILRGGKPKDAEFHTEGSGKLIEYDDTPEIIEMRSNIQDYMDVIHDHVISNPADPKSWQRYPFIRRVFNNSRWDNGGRYYGGEWQTCKREFRQHILIDGDETIELDFVALHACLAYARKGIGWWEKVENLPDVIQDPYQTMGKIGEPQWRHFCKKAFNIALSSSSETSTMRALHKLRQTDLRIKSNLFPEEMAAKGVLTRELRAFLGPTGRHAGISDLFYSGVGLELQYVDSMIAEDIYKAFAVEGRPVLGIHDSFIAKRSDRDFLEDSMMKAYRKVVRFKPKFK
jgi:hypothetical protein